MKRLVVFVTVLLPFILLLNWGCASAPKQSSRIDTDMDVLPSSKQTNYFILSNTPDSLLASALDNLNADGENKTVRQFVVQLGSESGGNNEAIQAAIMERLRSGSLDTEEFSNLNVTIMESDQADMNISRGLDEMQRNMLANISSKPVPFPIYNDAKTKELADILANNDYVSIPLKHYTTGFGLYVNTEINGVPANLVLEPHQNQISAICTSRAYRFDLDFIESELLGTEEQKIEIATINNLSISSLHIETQQVRKSDFTSINKTLESMNEELLDGSLGFGILQDRGAIIDLSAMRIYLTKSKATDDQLDEFQSFLHRNDFVTIPLTTNSQSLRFHAEVNGAPALLQLGIAAPFTLIDHDKFELAVRLDGAQIDDATGFSAVSLASTIDTIQIGEVLIENFTVRISPAISILNQRLQSADEETIGGLLGLDILIDRRAVVDLSKMMLYLFHP